MISFKGRHFQQDMLLQSVRWYMAYALSYREIKEIMKERGFEVDHSRRGTHYLCTLLYKLIDTNCTDPWAVH